MGLRKDVYIKRSVQKQFVKCQGFSLTSLIGRVSEDCHHKQSHGDFALHRSLPDNLWSVDHVVRLGQSRSKSKGLRRWREGGERPRGEETDRETEIQREKQSVQCSVFSQLASKRSCFLNACMSVQWTSSVSTLKTVVLHNHFAQQVLSPLRTDIVVRIDWWTRWICKEYDDSW